jgi:hypothetical protein
VLYLDQVSNQFLPLEFQELLDKNLLTLKSREADSLVQVVRAFLAAKFQEVDFPVHNEFQVADNQVNNFHILKFQAVHI